MIVPGVTDRQEERGKRMTLRIGWFSTGHNVATRNLLKTVLDNKEQGLLDISVSFVFCDWEEGEAPSHPDFVERNKFFDLVHSFEIPLITLSARKVKEQWKDDPSKDWRLCFGKKMRTMIYGRPFELGVLAGYAPGVDGDTCTRFDLIELRPSLPGGPKGTWQEVICQIIRSRAKRHGATIHLCTASGTGPPMTYCSYPLDAPEFALLWLELDAMANGRSYEVLPSSEIERSRLFQRIRREDEARMIPFVTYTIKLFADGDLDIVNGKPMAEGANLTSAYDLTKMVDRSLAQGQS